MRAEGTDGKVIQTGSKPRSKPRTGQFTQYINCKQPLIGGAARVIRDLAIRQRQPP